MLRRTFLKGFSLSPFGLLAAPVVAEKTGEFTLKQFYKMRAIFDAEPELTRINALKPFGPLRGIPVDRVMFDECCLMDDPCDYHKLTSHPKFPLGTKRVFPDGIERTYVKFA